MTKIQKVLREIENLRDFYKRTQVLRERIQKKAAERVKAEQQDKRNEKVERPRA
jgi:hypothetical protein